MIDIQFDVGGRRVNSRDLGSAMEDLMFSAVAEQLHAQLSGVRDPETGESPLVAVRGCDLSNLTLEISGSDRVVALAKQRLGIDESESPTVTDSGKPVRVFLSHASEDKDIARRIATRLIESGIDTFFDEWEIRPGDSIRQRIDQGLEECSHFIVLTTETSIGKDWVKSEIDGVYRRKIEGHCRLIPLRYKLEPRRLPPSLGSLLAPSIDNFDEDMKALVDAIYDISRKPIIGSPPATVSGRLVDRALPVSAGAESIIRYCMERTQHGTSFDPQMDAEIIINTIGLSKDDAIDAIDELESSGFVQHIRFLGDGGIGHVVPTDPLYTNFDKYFTTWNPEEDALEVAIALVNEVCDGNSRDLAQHLQWNPRRLNPAITYLVERKLVDASHEIGCHPWTCSWVRKNSKTRRFVRDRS